MSLCDYFPAIKIISNVSVSLTFILNITFSVVSRCASSMTPPSHGTVNCTNGREVGSECTFYCSTDYELNGSTTRTCIESGNSAYWSGSETHCKGKYLKIEIH